MEIGSSSQSVGYRLFLYDFQSNGLVLIGSGLARADDEKLEFRINGGASRFLDPRGQFHCVVRMSGGKFGSRFTTRIDELVLNFR